MWSTTSSSFSDWHLAQVNFVSTTNSNYEFTIQFEMSASTYSGFVGIDDIVVQNGRCVTSTVCDFENDFCKYTNDPSADFEWKRGNSSSSSDNTGPAFDQTTNTPDGFFAYIDSKEQLAGKAARLISPIQEKTAGSCIHFYFHAFGVNSDLGTLNLYGKKENSLGLPLITISGNYGNKWYVSQTSVASPSSTWQAVFEVIGGKGPLGNFAIDDIKITKGNCPMPASCNFEYGTLCEFTNPSYNQINWLISKGSTSTSWLTGPSIDHTTSSSTGGFALLNTNLPIQTGWKGALESEVILGNGSPQCVRFWYHMYSLLSTNMGTLNVYVKDVATMTSLKIWTVTYSQGSTWQEGKFPVNRTQSYQIVFEGIKGSGVGNIGLDDLQLFPSSYCSVLPTKADALSTTTTRTTSTTTTTTTTSTTSSTTETTTTMPVTTTASATKTSSLPIISTKAPTTVTLVNKCPKDYCKNNGVCNEQNEQFTCECLIGFSGKFCENVEEIKPTTTSLFTFLDFRF